MGAWGVAPFDNDDAADFLQELLEDGAPALQEAFEVVLDIEGYLEATEGARAVAAAEVLAAHLGGDPEPLTSPELRPWLGTLGPAELAHLSEPALDALERVEGEESELADQWAEGGEAAAWRAELERLRAVLAGR